MNVKKAVSGGGPNTTLSTEDPGLLLQRPNNTMSYIRVRVSRRRNRYHGNAMHSCYSTCLQYNTIMPNGVYIDVRPNDIGICWGKVLLY